MRSHSLGSNVQDVYQKYLKSEASIEAFGSLYFDHCLGFVEAFESLELEQLECMKKKFELPLVKVGYIPEFVADQMPEF